jgi:hypothetical protein
VLLFFAFPLVLVSGLLVPAGVPHLAYRASRVLMPHSIVEERPGGATFYELRSRVRRGRGLGDESVKRLAVRLSPLFDDVNDRAVRGATVAALGMFEAIGSNREGARELFGVVEDMYWRHAPRAARAFCQSFLLADRARRGAFYEIVRCSKRGPRTRRRALLGACALRLLGRPERPSSSTCVLLWLVAPNRSGHFGLLKQALAAPVRAELEIQGSGLAAATAATQRLAAIPRGFATRRELFRVASVWQAALESGCVRSFFTARRDALEANFGVSELEAAFEQKLVELFASLLRETLASEEPPGEEPWLVTSAKDALESALLDELEAAAASLPSGDSRDLAGFDAHWRTWAHLRRLAADFVDFLPDRRHALYDAVGTEIFNYGAWLHNRRDALLLAHDVFRFLLPLVSREAEDHATLKNNLKIARAL